MRFASLSKLFQVKHLSDRHTEESKEIIMKTCGRQWLILVICHLWSRNLRYLSFCAGHASKTFASPPTAAKWWFHSHATDSSLPSTPAQVEPLTVPPILCSSEAFSYHFTKPERTSKISPWRSSVPCAAATASRSWTLIVWRSIGEYSMPCVFAHDK